MKNYLSVVQLVYRSNRGRFLGVIGLSVLVGLIEGLLTQVNIIVLTSIQNIMAGGGDYGILITSFVVYYFFAPNWKTPVFMTTSARRRTTFSGIALWQSWNPLSGFRF